MPPFSRPFACALAALAAAGVLSGCTSLDVPKAENYPVSSQKKARAVHHWDVLADDVASRAVLTVRAAGRSATPLYVVPATAGSAFDQGFRNLLTTRLVERGLAVSAQPTGLRLAFETQVVEHASRLSNRGPAPATTLAAGVAVVRDLAKYSHTNASAIGGAVVLGAVVDTVNYTRHGSAAGGPTATELVVSTALLDGDIFIGRTADIYYIEGDAAALYLPPPAPAPATPLKTWKVVGP